MWREVAWGAMSTPEETTLAYVEAWHTPDAQRRRALLDRCWADDGSYTDPTNRAHGREELLSLIAAFRARLPGARISLTSGVDGHDGMVRFRWVFVQPDGTRREGFDIGELDNDGRLRRITGFFGPFPPVPESWPRELVERI